MVTEMIHRPNDSFSRIVGTAARQGRLLAERLVGQGCFEPLKLYFRPAKGEMDGELKFFKASEQVGPDWQEATEHLLTGNIPYSDFGAWVDMRARRLSLLGVPSAKAAV